MGKAHNASALPQSRRESLAKSDPHVFHRVMQVDVRVADRFNLESEFPRSGRRRRFPSRLPAAVRCVFFHYGFAERVDECRAADK